MSLLEKPLANLLKNKPEILEKALTNALQNVMTAQPAELPVEAPPPPPVPAGMSKLTPMQDRAVKGLSHAIRHDPYPQSFKGSDEEVLELANEASPWLWWNVEFTLEMVRMAKEMAR